MVSTCGRDRGVRETGIGVVVEAGELCGRGRRAATAVDALLFVLQYVPGLSLYPVLVRVP